MQGNVSNFFSFHNGFSNWSFEQILAFDDLNERINNFSKKTIIVQRKKIN